MVLLTPLEDYLLNNGWWAAIPGYYTNGNYYVSSADKVWQLRDADSMPLASGNHQKILNEVQKL